jgi:hypothetical protein
VQAELHGAPELVRRLLEHDQESKLTGWQACGAGPLSGTDRKRPVHHPDTS